MDQALNAPEKAQVLNAWLLRGHNVMTGAETLLGAETLPNKVVVASASGPHRLR
jgi:hypothetical protein